MTHGNLTFIHINSETPVLKIRLQRTGRKKMPFYRVVVAEHSTAVQGSYIDQIGFYNPLVKPWSFEVNADKALEWVKKGAKPTNTVARLLKASGVKGMESFIIEMKDRKKKNAPPEEEKAPEKPAEIPASEVPAPAEKAVEETKKETTVEELIEEVTKEENLAEAQAEDTPDEDVKDEEPKEEESKEEESNEDEVVEDEGGESDDKKE